MYLEYYSLKRDPFQITPDVSFYFDSRVHKRALATISYGLSKKEGFVVVTGEIGAGKTTLIEFLLARGDLRDVVTARISTTQLEAENLLELLVGELGLRKTGASKAAFLRDLNSFFLRTAQRGKSVLLIVDEVQNLSQDALEELRMLSNFQNGDRPLVQMLLVGQPEFRERLAGKACEQIRQRVIASFHLAPINDSDVPVYIDHRLHQAGWKGDDLFTPAACARIHEETGGVPRKINRLCDRLMLYGYLEELERIDRDAVDSVTGEMRLENLADRPEPAQTPAPAPDEPIPPAAPLAAPVPAAERKIVVMPEPEPEPDQDAGSYDNLLDTLDDLRHELGSYKTRMERILRLVAEQERRRRGEAP